MKQIDIRQDEDQISIFDILYPERKNSQKEEKKTSKKELTDRKGANNEKTDA